MAALQRHLKNPPASLRDLATFSLRGIHKALPPITGGAQIQVDHVLLGVESDIDRADISGQGIVKSSLLPQPIDSRATIKMNWVGAARTRVGYAQDNWLYYVTGVLAVFNAKTQVQALIPLPQVQEPPAII